MFDYDNSAVVFWWVLATYFLPMVAGFIFGKIKAVSLVQMSEIGKKLTDPLTIKLHNWSRQYKMACIKNGQWFMLFLLIFLNNLILAAFVTRILYGIIFIIPLFLTAWTGFAHGLLLSKPKGRTGISLMFFEFGGYLLATVIGVEIGISILVTLIKGTELIINLPWAYPVLMILFLLSGAAIESLSLKEVSKKIDLSNIDKIDYEKRRKEIVKQFDQDD